MATHSRILAWEIPQTEEPVATVHGGHKESDTTEASACGPEGLSKWLQGGVWHFNVPLGGRAPRSQRERGLGGPATSPFSVLSRLLWEEERRTSGKAGWEIR